MQVEISAQRGPAHELLMPIIKVDSRRRRIHGIASIELPDKIGEKMDYARSKPLIQQWSDSLAAVSEGKNLGNVRMMHPKIKEKVAIGRVIKLTFDDARKAVLVTIEIDDDYAWDLIVKRTLVGLSMGGYAVGGTWVDTEGHTCYALWPNEVSVVDNAMIPECNGIVIMKADGSLVLVDPIEKSSGGEIMEDTVKPQAPAIDYAELTKQVVTQMTPLVVAEITKMVDNGIGKQVQALEQSVETVVEAMARTIQPPKAKVTAVAKSADSSNTETTKETPKVEQAVPMVGALPIEKADVQAQLREVFAAGGEAPWFLGRSEAE